MAYKLNGREWFEPLQEPHTWSFVIDNEVVTATVTGMINGNALNYMYVIKFSTGEETEFCVNEDNGIWQCAKGSARRYVSEVTREMLTFFSSFHFKQ